MVIHQTLLGTWGDLGAIVSGVSVLAIGGYAAFRWFRASELDHALHTTRAPLGVDNLDDQSFSLRIGINLTNGTTKPVSYFVMRFDLLVADIQSPMTEIVAREDVAPSQTKGWYRDHMDIAKGLLPCMVFIYYEIHYGRRAKSPRRKLSGQAQLKIGLDSNDMLLPASFFEYLEPERDEKLTKSERKEMR